MARISTPHAVRGTQDMFGETAERFGHVVDTFDRVRRLYGFKAIQIPVFEATQVFTRSLGETTDVVGKEMYSFEDKGGDSITLRPEFTAGIARAYITNGWQQHAPLKVTAHGPAFRYERPQKGRYRQFHQIDAETIGAGEPMADVELIAFAAQLIAELGIAEGATLNVNTLGDAPSREAWRAALVAHFEAHRDVLSEESLDRLGRNPLRILDSKDPRDRPVADAAPVIDAYLTGEAQDIFGAVTAGLDASGIAWTREPRLVRGLDYYRHAAFEFVTDRLGAQGQLLGGGRYDGLIEALGGPPTPAVGWAAGIERLAMLVDAPEIERPLITVMCEAPEAEKDVVAITNILRTAGISADFAYKGNAKRRFELAMRRGSRARLVVSPNFVSAGGPLDRQGIPIRLNQIDSFEQADPAVIAVVLAALGKGFTVVPHAREALGFAVDAVLQPLRCT